MIGPPLIMKNAMRITAATVKNPAKLLWYPRCIPCCSRIFAFHSNESDCDALRETFDDLIRSSSSIIALSLRQKDRAPLGRRIVLRAIAYELRQLLGDCRSHVLQWFSLFPHHPR